MEKRLELEKRGRNPDQIKELNLDNARSATIDGLTDDYCNLEVLSLINVGLANLKGFPNLPKLKRLELSDNRISNGLHYLKGCPNLQYLTLCGNKISDFDALQPLKDLKNLENLDLFSCDITQSENYREKVFNLIPSLKYLDGFDKNDKEYREIDEEEGDESEEDINEDEEIDEEDHIVDEELDEADEEDEELSEEDEEEVGLSALIGDINEEESEEENFEPEATNGDHASDSEIESDADESKDLSETRGVKRKHETEEQDN